MMLRRMYRYLLLIGSGGLLLQETAGCTTEEVLDGLFKMVASMVVQQAMSNISF